MTRKTRRRIARAKRYIANRSIRPRRFLRLFKCSANIKEAVLKGTGIAPKDLGRLIFRAEMRRGLAAR